MRHDALMHLPLLARFEESCVEASISPHVVLKAAGVHPSLWWKWKTGRVSPTLRNFEAAVEQLIEMGGKVCLCDEKPKGGPS